MLVAISCALASPPTGTYQGCEVPPVLSVTASTKNTAQFAPRRAVVVGGDLVVGGYITGSATETQQDLTIAGPFTAADPGGASATYEHEDIVTSEPGDLGLVMINTATGAPSGMLHVRGAGDDYIYGLSAGGPDGTVLGIGGDFTGNITAITSSCTPVIWPAGETVACEANATTLTITPNREGAYSSHLISMKKDGSVNWLRGAWPSNGIMFFDPHAALTHPALTPPSPALIPRSPPRPHPAFPATGENLVGGTRVDSAGNVYAVGYFCKPPVAGEASGTEYCKSCDVVCSAIVAKFKADDGSLLWKKEYPELIYASQLDIDEADDALYFSGEMYNGAGSAVTSTPLDVDVACTEDATKNCAMLARISLTDGATQWVRLVHGTTGYAYRSDGEVHLAKAADGPYVYVAFNEASLDGPAAASLDRGSAYAGCLLADGSVTPEYDISITKVITAADCPSGSTFVPRTAANAVAATAAGTGASCAGYNRDLHTSCLVKYHSYTGKPIWGSVTPQVKAFVPQADGVIAFGSGQVATFDTVKLPMRGQSMIWQSKLQKDTGAGEYVQSIGGPSGGTRLYTAAEDTDGNVFAVGYVACPASTHPPPPPAPPPPPPPPPPLPPPPPPLPRPRPLDPTPTRHRRYTSAVSGYALDAQSPTYTLPLDHADAFIAIKYGTAQAAVRPPCSGASTCTPTPGNCLISNICYANAYVATNEGVPCLMCDASTSSTAWTNGPTIGTTECLIDGACTAANQNNCALATALAAATAASL